MARHGDAKSALRPTTRAGEPESRGQRALKEGGLVARESDEKRGRQEYARGSRIGRSGFDEEGGCCAESNKSSNESLILSGS